MGKYTDYVMKTAQDLLAVPSPSGFTHMAAEFVKKEFENLGYKPQITQKGAVLVKLGGKDDRECSGSGGSHGYSWRNGLPDHGQRTSETD